MPFTIVPTRTTADPNSAADVNTLMENSTFTKSSRNRVDGLLLSNSPGDTQHDITIAAGICKDSTFVYTLELTSTLTKRIDAAWSAGDNGGFLDTGSVAINTQYAVWLIRKDSDGTSDAVASTSFTSPSPMPTGYTYKRLLRGFATDGSANIINNQWLITDIANDRPANLIVTEEQPQNTAGSTYAINGWRTRVINTVKLNEIPGAILSSNRVSLPIGRYKLGIQEAHWGPSGTGGQYRVYNITSASTSVILSQFGNIAGNTTCFATSGTFYLDASSQLEIQLYPVIDSISSSPSNITTEVYLIASFEKIG